jgi:hypothetical protein
MVIQFRVEGDFDAKQPGQLLFEASAPASPMIMAFPVTGSTPKSRARRTQREQQWNKPTS